MTKPSESGFDFYGVTNEEEVFATLTRAADLGVTFKGELGSVLCGTRGSGIFSAASLP